MQSPHKYNAVLHAAHLLLKSLPHAAERFAIHLGKKPNTVRNELNPNIPEFKLGLLDALEMMHVSGNYSLLYQMNAACGFIAVPAAVSIPHDKKLLDVFCQWQASVGATCQSIFDAMEDEVITPAEMNTITRAGNHKMGEWVRMQNALQLESEKVYGDRR